MNNYIGDVSGHVEKAMKEPVCKGDLDGYYGDEWDDGEDEFDDDDDSWIDEEEDPDDPDHYQAR